MNYQPVVSSNITNVGYDDESQTLAVRFSSGREYRYPGVRSEQYAALVSAPSVGSHFAQHIKPNHTGIPV